MPSAKMTARDVKRLHDLLDWVDMVAGGGLAGGSMDAEWAAGESRHARLATTPRRKPSRPSRAPGRSVELEVEALRGERDNAVARAAESDGWRHVAGYYLGDYVLTHTPEEARAEAVRRASLPSEPPDETRCSECARTRAVAGPTIRAAMDCVILAWRGADGSYSVRGDALDALAAALDAADPSWYWRLNDGRDPAEHMLPCARALRAALAREDATPDVRAVEGKIVGFDATGVYLTVEVPRPSFPVNMSDPVRMVWRAPAPLPSEARPSVREAAAQRGIVLGGDHLAENWPEAAAPPSAPAEGAPNPNKETP